MTVQSLARPRVGAGSLIRRHRQLLVASSYLIVAVGVAIFATQIAPYPPRAIDLHSQLAGPSAEHWLGTDDVGRDILSRLVFGARTSLLASILGVAIAVVIALPLGMLAGLYNERLVDLCILRVADALQALPPLVIAMVLVSVRGPGIFNTALALGIAFAPVLFRITRGEVAATVALPFISASRSIGTPEHKILLRRVLPNIAPPLLVQASTLLGLALLIEASLSFLGLGAPPPAPSWGGMLLRAFQSIFVAPWQIYAPGLVILLTTSAFYSLGDGLRRIVVLEHSRVDQ